MKQDANVLVEEDRDGFRIKVYGRYPNGHWDGSLYFHFENRTDGSISGPHKIMSVQSEQIDDALQDGLRQAIVEFDRWKSK